MQANINLEISLPNNIKILNKHIELLKAVDKFKSITKAAKYVGISYKNAWDSIDTINKGLKEPLILRLEGNKKNSGSELSKYALNLIEKYDKLQTLQTDFLQKLTQDRDFDSINLSNLNSINMSARNQLEATIKDIKDYALNSSIILKITDNEAITALITLKSKQNLKLEIGKKVLLAFKSCSVSINKNISENNTLNGVIKEVKIGSTCAEITLKTKSNKIITATISKDYALDMRLCVGDNISYGINPNAIIICV